MQISMVTLLASINRKLSQDGLELRKSRNSRSVHKLGEYYAVNLNRNFLVAKDINPEVWGRELGILGKDDSVVGSTLSGSKYPPVHPRDDVLRAS